MNWTPEIVLARLIEAADVDWRSPRPKIGPQSAPGFWPSYNHTREDMNGWGTKRLAEIREMRAPRVLPRADELSRTDEVLDWSLRIMGNDERKILWAYAFAIVSGRSFSDWCRKTGRVRRTVYRQINKALDRISVTLGKTSIFLRLPDLERVSQLMPSMASEIGKSGNCAEAA